jgi:hypothetical protein
MRAKMRRARVVRIWYHPGHPLVGCEGWVKKLGRPVDWDEDCYVFYPDSMDETYPLAEREFEFLSDREH